MMDPRPRQTFGSSALRRLDDADQVPLWVVEKADLDLFHDLLRTHHPRPAEALCLRQRGLHVGDPVVEGDVTRIALRPSSDAATNSGALATVAVNHPVVHRVIGVDLPSEQVGVKGLQRCAVLTDDLEVHYWLSHDVSLGVLHVRAQASRVVVSQAFDLMTPARRRTHRRGAKLPDLAT